MKKKIKIKINGKINKIDDKTKLSDLVKNLKVPLKKVAIELNKEIDFYTAQKFIQLHDSIKKSDYVSRVFSIRNDRELINWWYSSFGKEKI